MNLRKCLSAAEAAVVWLFLLQATRVLFSALFGVIYDAVFDADLPFIIVVLDVALVIAAMLAPLLLRWLRDRPLFATLAVLLTALARVPLSLEDPAIRLYAAILVLGGGAFYIARLLHVEPARLMHGFILGLAADQLLRATDYTFDPTLRPEGLPTAAILAVAAILVSLYLARKPAPSATAPPHVSVGLSLGAALFLQTSLLALPNALSRWTGLGYDWAASLLLLVTLLPLGPTLRTAEIYLATWLWPMDSVFASLAALVSLALAALLRGGLAALFFLLTQLLLLFILRTSVTQKRLPPDVPARTPGLETSMGFGLFLLFSFAFAFTFTYPYTLPFFRGLGTPVLLLGLLVATAPVYHVTLEPEVARAPLRDSALTVGALTIVTVTCALLTRLPSWPVDRPDATLRLATYNIHYGYDSDWCYTLDDIAATIAAEDVDVIVLQEVDAGRITSYSVDTALWLGQRLKMHVVYQPTLEKLSGIALLSRYPLADSGGQWLTSGLEQTAIVYGVVETDSRPLRLYGTWLGLEPEERAAQLSDALDLIGATRPATLGGDFNATPDSPVYARLRDAGFIDPFVALGKDFPPTSPAIDPTERIDYVWLRGLTPRDAWVPASTASDHRMVVVEVDLSQ